MNFRNWCRSTWSSNKNRIVNIGIAFVHPSFIQLVYYNKKIRKKAPALSSFLFPSVIIFDFNKLICLYVDTLACKNSTMNLSLWIHHKCEMKIQVYITHWVCIWGKGGTSLGQGRVPALPKFSPINVRWICDSFRVNLVLVSNCLTLLQIRQPTVILNLGTMVPTESLICLYFHNPIFQLLVDGWLIVLCLLIVYISDL